MEVTILPFTFFYCDISSWDTVLLTILPGVGQFQGPPLGSNFRRSGVQCNILPAVKYMHPSYTTMGWDNKHRMGLQTYWKGFYLSPGLYKFPLSLEDHLLWFDILYPIALKRFRHFFPRHPPPILVNDCRSHRERVGEINCRFLQWDYGIFSQGNPASPSLDGL